MLSDLSTAPWFRRLLVAAIMLGILTLTYVILQPFIIPVIWAGMMVFCAVGHKLTDPDRKQPPPEFPGGTDAVLGLFDTDHNTIIERVRAR